MTLTVSRDIARTDRPHSLPLPCIVCGAPLPAPPWSYEIDDLDGGTATVDDCTECPTCGVRYSGELLRTAHPEQWAYIMLNGLACTACDERVPAIYAEDGHPVPCPRHGATL